MKLVKGQLVVITYREEDDSDAWWEYGVVLNLYDNRTEILRKGKAKFMYVQQEKLGILDNQPTKRNVTPLTVNGEPVISSKNIFGKYNFKPKK